MKVALTFSLALFALVFGSSCALKEPERRPVGPQSSESYQAWNSPRKGEMQGQLGMLNQR